jgi:CDP-diacylglycerol--glycerol-3-phosphate 3-phosphatidyltransferase
VRVVSILPNLLTVLRLGMAIVFPVAPATWHLALVVGAGVSDWLDGFIARRFDVRSLSGQLLDAIADKLFAVSVLVTLTIAGDILWWQAVLAVSRDLIVAGTGAYAAASRDWGRFKDMVPRLPGKLTTAAVFAWFITLTASWLQPVAGPLFVIVAAISLWAGADYLVQFAKALRHRRRVRMDSDGQGGDA